jgi:hypothetical protein
MTLQDRIRYVLKRPIFYKNGLLYVPSKFDIMIDYAYRDARQGKRSLFLPPSPPPNHPDKHLKNDPD